ncbi:MAG TPA: class I SAM-dependent methyltransferase [Nitrospirota bacterium]|nr:class I SAM-dependent methyltransferase [Nitrospirota bacterium]
MLNYEYAIDLTKRLVKSTSPCVLDYGCGAGQIVEKALAAGFDAYGVEEFYEGGSYHEDAKITGMLGRRIFELKEGNIPFPNQKFDVVISNQVFEHIDDYSFALAEIDRVLNPSGIFINVFPSAEVWREGHIGIPFAHWFLKRSKIRLYYVIPLRMLGMGFHKENKTIKQWALDQLDWIDKWTFYKPASEIERSFSAYFTISYYNADYILFRLKKHAYLSHIYPLLSKDLFRPFLNFICVKLASRIFVLRKR